MAWTYLLIIFFGPAICVAMAGYHTAAAVVALLEVVGFFGLLIWARATQERKQD
jgi:uncharacterized membrane protein